ncbi:MAG: Mur ligase family protein, partial [Sulfuricella sp.]
EDAWEAAGEIGVPVVVKPRDGNHGRGVSTELMTREEVEAAYKLALDEGSDVIVERFVRGNEHRLLVVGGRLAAAARGESAFVVGDGRSTLIELIDTQINTDPRRGTTEDYPLNRVVVDEDPAVRLEITRQGFTPDAIPPLGAEVMIQRNGNVAFDVTDLVHPDVAATVCLAARIVGLDIAGVDLVAEDISRPLDEQRGAIVEVNAGPGLLMHLKPASGEPRPIGRAIVDSLFPAAENGRIPVVGITGTNGTNLVARLVACLLHLSGKRVGLACSDGLYHDQRLVEKGNRATWAAARKVLLNRVAEAAVFENGSDMILSEGLAYDRCQVGVVTDIDPARHFGKYYIETPDQVFNVLRTQVDVVLTDGVAVLNGNDPMAAEMAPLCDGEVIFFGAYPDVPAIADHLTQGKRAVLVRDGFVALATGNQEVRLVEVSGIMLAGAGVAGLQIENVLAAAGAAWALGLPLELIRAGIETFRADQ